MNPETIYPDLGFSREQKEYLQGYFAGLACSGIVPFAGHLPDGPDHQPACSESDQWRRRIRVTSRRDSLREASF
jgi:hypothetical protein